MLYLKKITTFAENLEIIPYKMTQKKIILSAIFMMLILSVYAQNTLIGKVVDSNSRQALDYVNVSISHVDNDTPIDGNITDENGEFILTGLADGTYNVTISFVGYITHIKTIALSAKEVDLGIIYLQEDSEVLNEIEVVAQGSTMRFELDKKIFSVDQNIAAAGGSATDILENIPSVDVDQEGNISLRNSEAVEIWINGKPAGLTAETRAQVLQQLPAESIKEIELITNPSAKYSPEGTAGIINLVMKKDRKPGYYGSVNIALDYGLAQPWPKAPSGHLGFNINLSKGIVDAYLNAGYFYHNEVGTSSTDRYNYNPTDTTLLVTRSTSNRQGGGLFLRGGVDVRLTDHSTIGVSAFGFVSLKNDPTGIFFSNHNSEPRTYQYYDVTQWDSPLSPNNQDSLLREYERTEQGHASYPGYNTMLSWTTEFNKSHKLLATAQFSQFVSTNDNFYIQSESQTILTQEQLSNNMDRSIQLKVDYEWKPTPQSRLETGWQTDIAWRNTQAAAFNGEQRQDTIWNYYNDFQNNEQIHALYVTYGNRWFDRLSLQVGLRGEYFMRHIATEYINLNEQRHIEEQDTTYFQLFPSAYISYSFDNGHELQLNYTRRVDRPRGHMINPRIDFADSTNIRFGNPSLLPSYSSALELNYLKNWERHTLSGGIFWRAKEGVVQNIKFMDGQTMKNTFVNLSSRQELGVELVSKNRLFGELLQLTTSVNCYYNALKANSYYGVINGTPFDVELKSQHIFVWFARMNASFMFTPTFSGQLSAMYHSPRVQAQGQSSHNYSIDFGLRKTFFDKKLSLAFNVRDLLNSRARKNTSFGDGFWQYQKNRWNSRRVSLSITYAFGNMNRKTPQHEMNTGLGGYSEGGEE